MPCFLIMDSHLARFGDVNRKGCLGRFDAQTHPSLLVIRAFAFNLCCPVIEAVLCFLVVHNQKSANKAVDINARSSRESPQRSAKDANGRGIRVGSDQDNGAT